MRKLLRYAASQATNYDDHATAKACRTRAPPAALRVGCGWRRSAHVTDGIPAHSEILRR